ncbi:hypothetical protein ACN9MU_18250 [Pseudoduganella sp. R-32]|uniref:hypothetical protein n=1 Tax=Pseudoduganella sp. R-32 TaxID=3404061 RepID=UPI003CF5AD7C
MFAKDLAEMVRRLVVDRQAHRRNAGLPGFDDGLPRIVQAILAFIMVDVVGFAVRQ